MASTIDKIKNDIIKALNASQRKTSAYDTEAEVVRIDGNTAWVHIAGGVSETPVNLTINAKKGDKVQCRVASDGAYIIGNATAPPTNDDVANLALSETKNIKTNVNNIAYIANEANEIAGYAMRSADGKSTVYHMASAPTGGEYQVGDTWFNSSEGYAVYTWNGSAWVKEEFGEDAIANLAITNAKIANGTIQSAKIGGLDVGKLTGGYIDAGHINTGVMTIGNFSSDFQNAVMNDKIQIGGRNLILNTTGEKESPASASNSAYVSPLTLSDFGDSIMNNTDDFFTYSFDYEVTGNSATGAYLYVQARDASVPTDSDGYSKNVYQNSTGHYCCKFHLTSAQASGTSKGMRIRLRNATDGAKVKVKNIKCELGNKETSWTPAPEDIESSIATAQSTADGANAEEQRIYYRSSSNTKPNGNGLPTAWVTETGDKYNTNATTSSGWSRKITPMASSVSGTKYIYLWTCIQRKTVDGTVTYGDILLDDSTTIIDGGSIVTGSIDANRINVTDLNASNAITIGALNTDTQNSILNDNIKLGGENLLKNTEYMWQYTFGANTVRQNDASSGFNNCFKMTGSNSDYSSNVNTMPTISKDWLDGETYHVFSFDYFIPSTSIDVSIMVVCAGSDRDVGVQGARTKYRTIANQTLSTKGKWQRANLLINPMTEANLTSGSGDVNSTYFNFYNRSNGGIIYVKNFKFEEGNKATAWSPAPDDENISGRNILLGSGDYSNWQIGSTFSSNISISGEEETISVSGKTSNFNAGAWGWLSKTYNEIKDEELVVSFDVYSSNWSNVTDASYPNNAGLYCVNFQMNTTSSPLGTTITTSGFPYLFMRLGSISGFWKVKPRQVNSNWLHFESKPFKLSEYFTSNASATAGDYVVVKFQLRMNGTVKMRHMKVEIGNKATAWTVAPEDVDADIEDASKVATDYVTRIDSNGIWVTPSNKKPTNTSTGAGATGTKIDGDGLQIFKNGVPVASYGDTVILGADASGISRAELTANGMEIFRNVSGTEWSLAHIGYGSGNNGNGDTADAPYYSFGERELSTYVAGNSSFVAGSVNTASGYCSVAMGAYNRARARYAFVEGYSNDTTGWYSHVEGQDNYASGNSAHAEGCVTEARGDYSHSQNYHTKANGSYQTAIGKYNVAETGGANAFIVGNGTADNARSNALALKWTGAMTIAGALTQNSDRRLKDHIDYLGEDAVEFIRGLKPAHYIKDDEHHVGFYAQDVEEVDKWDCMVGEMNDYKTLGYTEIIAPLVAYVQKLESRIEELERERK